MTDHSIFWLTWVIWSTQSYGSIHGLSTLGRREYLANCLNWNVSVFKKKVNSISLWINGKGPSLLFKAAPLPFSQILRLNINRSKSSTRHTSIQLTLAKCTTKFDWFVKFASFLFILLKFHVLKCTLYSLKCCAHNFRGIFYFQCSLSSPL